MGVAGAPATEPALGAAGTSDPPPSTRAPSASESARREGTQGAWPASLRRFATRVLDEAQRSDAADRASARDALRRLIAEAIRRGAMRSVDWDALDVPQTPIDGDGNGPAGGGGAPPAARGSEASRQAAVAAAASLRGVSTRGHPPGAASSAETASTFLQPTYSNAASRRSTAGGAADGGAADARVWDLLRDAGALAPA
jgi:hypothetical protein